MVKHQKEQAKNQNKDSTNNYLIKWVKDQKEENQSLSCKECIFEGKNAYDLKYHLLEKHRMEQAGDESYKCEICVFKATTALSLLIHQRRKHLRKQVKCSNCDFTSDMAPVLKRHEKKEHNIKYDFVCKTCGDVWDQHQQFFLLVGNGKAGS